MWFSINKPKTRSLWITKRCKWLIYILLKYQISELHLEFNVSYIPFWRFYRLRLVRAVLFSSTERKSHWSSFFAITLYTCITHFVNNIQNSIPKCNVHSRVFPEEILHTPDQLPIILYVFSFWSYISRRKNPESLWRYYGVCLFYMIYNW